MAWGKPLIAEWQLVTKATGNPEGTLFHTFSVSNDGTITETNNRLVFVSGPHALTPTEFKILDALVNQINREPIPADHLTFPPDRNDQDRWLSLDNDPDISSTLFSDTAAGTSYAADDKLDIVEIAVLNAYLGYLDNKYDPPFMDI